MTSEKRRISRSRRGKNNSSTAPAAGTNVTGLHVPQIVGELAGPISAAIKGRINHALVNASPKHNAGNCDQRLDKNPRVELVNPVFVCDHAVKAVDRSSDATWQFWALMIKKPCKQKSECRNRDGNGRQELLRRFSFRAPVW